MGRHGGSGTAEGHWNEDNDYYSNGSLLATGYGNEIMTGWIDNQNYLSDFTVASLVDVGYTLVSDYYVNLAGPQSSDIALNSDTGYQDLLVA